MKIEGAKIAVTGATGMLGVYICRSLANRGAKVIGVVRNPGKAAFLEDEGIEFRRADLLDYQSLVEAFSGCDALVSNAALYSLSNFDWHENYQANKTGTENVLKAAAEKNLKRIVQISTVGIYQFNLFQTLDENSPQVNGEKQEGGAYRATKQISESLAWQLAGQLQLDLTTLRPSAVYGARDHNFMPACYAAMHLPLLPLPRLTWPIVHAADVADAVAASLADDNSIGQAYNTSGEDASLLEFFKAFKAVAQKGPVILDIPIEASQRISNLKAKRQLGFKNRSFMRGLSEIIAEEPGKLN